jgi:hypothetical protein
VEFSLHVVVNLPPQSVVVFLYIPCPERHIGLPESAYGAKKMQTKTGAKKKFQEIA